MTRVLTSLIASIVEAWGELRVHRLRVLLSLIGVALAVAAITGVVAAGAVAQQAQTEQSERYGGRPALLAIYISDDEGKQPNSDLVDPAFQRIMARYDIRYGSHVLSLQLPLTTPSGTVQPDAKAIDPDYATMHRLRTLQGRGPNAADERRLAPAVVIDQNTWKLLGSPALATHPTVSLVGDRPVTAVVVGVQRADCEQCYSLVMLYDQVPRLGLTSDVDNSNAWELWVPPSQARALSSRIEGDLEKALGEGWQVSVNRSDYQAAQDGDPLLYLKLAIGGIAGLVLLLGALGLLNISLVTVRYRIREIGIRRSFGATAPRVFFSVMMESVVGTVVAGVIGVVLAIIALKNPWVSNLISSGVQDVPPFPVSAAVLGLVVSTLVGALAGLLPAIVAVRVKPIDAIRY